VQLGGQGSWGIRKVQLGWQGLAHSLGGRVQLGWQRAGPLVRWVQLGCQVLVLRMAARQQGGRVH